ncbi:MAG: hypothetical protein JRD89_03515 [Deltaproteobacteria bacterium]|nr:hypothetical protein [Deltaproteobacteria bacterium]
MRKITQDAAHAFNAGRTLCRDNTTVAVDPDGEVMLCLHGNLIAKRTADGRLFVRTAGWDTTTTKERLNGLGDVQVYHERRVLHLNGKPWDNHADWTEVAAA